MRKSCRKLTILYKLRLLDLGQLGLISVKFNGPLLNVSFNSLFITFDAQGENLVQKYLVYFLLTFYARTFYFPHSHQKGFQRNAFEGVRNCLILGSESGL